MGRGTRTRVVIRVRERRERGAKDDRFRIGGGEGGRERKNRGPRKILATPAEAGSKFYLRRAL